MTREEYLIIKVLYLEMKSEVEEIENGNDFDKPESIEKIKHFFELEEIINEYESK